LNEAERLARSLMARHGLRDWSFRFDRARRRFGCCNYTTKTLSLSRHLTLLNAREVVRDTILHEIAHALTPGANHGPAWRKKCLEVGAKPERCYHAGDVRQPEAKYQLVCPGCKARYPRHRRTRGAFICRACYQRHRQGELARPYELVWHRRR
jgi:predicted SprT family Zn-dependent metalloprotease